jgi:hypothetical protein
MRSTLLRAPVVSCILTTHISSRTPGMDSGRCLWSVALRQFP